MSVLLSRRIVVIAATLVLAALAALVAQTLTHGPSPDALASSNNGATEGS
jgi:hypothetical protein